MNHEIIVEDREQGDVYELTMEELEAVSGGCGKTCCPKAPCNCG